MDLLLKRKYTLGAILLIIPLGLATKYYAGPARDWVNNSLGGILYVIFFSLFFSVVFSRARTWKTVTLVLLATCLVEVLQCWHPAFLERARSTFIGVTLLGNSFSFSDLLHYLAGALLSWGLIELLNRLERPVPS